MVKVGCTVRYRIKWNFCSQPIKFTSTQWANHKSLKLWKSCNSQNLKYWSFVMPCHILCGHVLTFQRYLLHTLWGLKMEVAPAGLSRTVASFTTLYGTTQPPPPPWYAVRISNLTLITDLSKIQRNKHFTQNINFLQTLIMLVHLLLHLKI